MLRLYNLNNKKIVVAPLRGKNFRIIPCAFLAHFAVKEYHNLNTLFINWNKSQDSLRMFIGHQDKSTIFQSDNPLPVS